MIFFFCLWGGKSMFFFFFFQAEDGIRDVAVTGVQTCALPISALQVAAGARAIQVFDSWVGAMAPDDYVRFAAPYSRAMIERIRATGVPVIHFGTGASGFFRELHAAGGDVLGVDWRINIDQAW